MVSVNFYFIYFICHSQRARVCLLALDLHVHVRPIYTYMYQIQYDSIDGHWVWRDRRPLGLAWSTATGSGVIDGHWVWRDRWPFSLACSTATGFGVIDGYWVWRDRRLLGPAWSKATGSGVIDGNWDLVTSPISHKCSKTVVYHCRRDKALTDRAETNSSNNRDQ